MDSSAYMLPARKFTDPVILDGGRRLFTEGFEQVDQWHLNEQKKLFGIQHTEVLTPEGDDVDYWDDVLNALDNRDLFTRSLKMIASPFEEPMHFAFKGPLSKEQRHSIHKMNKKGELKTITCCENGVRILHVLLSK